MLNKTEQDLHDFITTKYAPNSFSTSWTTCSVFGETPEEILVGALVKEHFGDAPVSWLSCMPSLLISLGLRAGIEFDDENPQWFAYEQFMLDMVRDLWACEYRDS